MNSAAIAHIDAFEILDSRGDPTLRVTIELEGGHRGIASVPSGASTGKREAVELRDADPKRFGGRGVLQAAANVRDIICRYLKGSDATDQNALDRRLIELDSSSNKSMLGANAIVGVSMAAARAAAEALGVPLYKRLGGPSARRMPVPMMNIINGGRHASNSLDFQEFMIVPHGARTFSESLLYGAETFHALRDQLRRAGFSTAVGDEGGFAPNLRSVEETCDRILQAIHCVGLRAGQDVALALDPAASSFEKHGSYVLQQGGKRIISRDRLLALYQHLTKAYPIVSIEDGFSEDDWEGFHALTATLGDNVQIVGDDIFVTDPRLIKRGIAEKTANSALIKLNQVGTVSETLDAIRACQSAGWGFIISHRSGETEDTFIADLAVAMGGGQIKTGSLSRSERLAKYNRLLEIERDLGAAAIYASPFLKPYATSKQHADVGT